jgi:hypothetical protein
MIDVGAEGEGLQVKRISDGETCPLGLNGTASTYFGAER